MKDNFSIQAKAYAQYRPYYPPEMISYIVSLVPYKDAALDVATGNGQVAAALTPYFKEVYGTDICAKQLQNATPAPNLNIRREVPKIPVLIMSSLTLLL